MIIIIIKDDKLETPFCQEQNSQNRSSVLSLHKISSDHRLAGLPSQEFTLFKLKKKGTEDGDELHPFDLRSILNVHIKAERNRTMSRVITFGVSVDAELFEEFDALIKKMGYANRSEAIRDLIGERLVEEE